MFFESILNPSRVDKIGKRISIYSVLFTIDNNFTLSTFRFKRSVTIKQQIAKIHAL